MSVRTLIRAAMIGVAVAVVVVVAMSWEGRPELPVEEELAGSVSPGDEDVVASTLGLHHVATVNGQVIYEVSAAEGVSSSANKYEYRGGVALVLYQQPEEEGGEVQVTQISGDRMSLLERLVPIEGDAYEEIRLMDGVRAVLPSGVEVLSDVITYSNGELYTDNGVRLYAADLVIEAGGFRYAHESQAGLMTGSHPDTLRPALQGPVRLWSAARGGNGDTGAFTVEGSSGDMVFDLRQSELTLRNGPALLLEDALVSGWEIVLGLDESAGGIESMSSRVDARAVWLTATAAGDHVVSGDLISIEMVEGAPQGLQVTHDVEAGGPRPRFVLGESGELRAARFDLGFGEAAAVEATGDAFFFPSANDARLEHIGAQRLTTGGGELDALTADGDVEVRMAGERGSIAFRGPRALLEYNDGDIASAEWPSGVSHEGEDGSEVTAGHGALETDTGNWILDGTPRPHFVSSDFDVEAGAIVLLPGGGIDLFEGVEAQLRGDLVRTVGPLFGGAAEIEASSDALEIRDGDRLSFKGNANIWQGDADYLMRAEEIQLLAPADELQAGGDVYVSLLDAAEDAEQSTTVVLTGRQLLVEGAPLGLVMAGGALLELVEDGRTIGGDRVEVSFQDDGAWESVEVVGNVVMTDAAGTGEGERLEYRGADELVVIYAGESKPATFVNDRGMDIRDGEGLRLSFDGDNLWIYAMQNGTTQTVRRGG